LSHNGQQHSEGADCPGRQSEGGGKNGGVI